MWEKFLLFVISEIPVLDDRVNISEGSVQDTDFIVLLGIGNNIEQEGVLKFREVVQTVEDNTVLNQNIVGMEFFSFKNLLIFLKGVFLIGGIGNQVGGDCRDTV